MVSVEQSVKAQYAKVFVVTDWELFKRTAEAQLKEAAYLKNADMHFEPKAKLRARNSRKRLLIGIGVELLLKAVYLKNGYYINKLKKDETAISFPFRLDEVASAALNEADTFPLSKLIDCVTQVVAFSDDQVVLKGLKIAKVFRNKEGHVVTCTHTFDDSNYRDIEAALAMLYKDAFNQTLNVRFSMEDDEQAVWRVSAGVAE